MGRAPERLDGRASGRKPHRGSPHRTLAGIDSPIRPADVASAANSASDQLIAQLVLEGVNSDTLTLKREIPRPVGPTGYSLEC